MPWASGAYNRLYGSTGWTDDKNASTFILSSRHDAHDQDLADGVNACLTRDNQSKPTAHFLPNATATYDLGSASVLWRNIYGYLSSLFVKYDQTAAEIAASVTPSNYSIVNDYTGKIVPERFLSGSNNPGVTDMTAAVQAAYAVLKANGYGELAFLGTKYLVSDIAINMVNADARMTIRGIPNRTIILNKAGASKPSFKLSGAQYFDIRGIVFIGATGFPNYGIELVRDGSSNRCGNAYIGDVVFQTNGAGIHMQDTNTLTIENYMYWPSGGSAFGGTIDTNGQPGFLIADDTGSGANNSIYLINGNISGLNTIANGGCGIRANNTTGANWQDWKIDRLNCERSPESTQRAIWLSAIDQANLMNVFTENTQVRFDKGCSRGLISVHAANTGTITMDGTSGGQFQMTFLNCEAKSITADSANDATTHINCIWATDEADSSTNKVLINTTDGGSTVADTIGGKGLVARKFIASAFKYVTYSASMTIDCSLANTFQITATNNTAFTINTPVNETVGQSITIELRNTSGGALGAATFGAGYKMSAWTNPANNFMRSITFVYDSVNAVWQERSRTTADIPL